MEVFISASADAERLGASSSLGVGCGAVSVEVGEDMTVATLRSLAAAMPPFRKAGCGADDILLAAPCGDPLPEGPVSATTLSQGDCLTASFTTEPYRAKLREGSITLHDCPPWAQCDPEAALAGIAHAGHRALEAAGAMLLDDKVFMLQAVRLDRQCLRFASPALRGDAGFLADVLKRHPLGLEMASAELRDSRPTVLLAVTRNGLSLEHASAALRDCKVTVAAALKSNGKALRFASDRLRADGETVRRVSPVWARLYAAPELRPARSAVGASLRR